MINPRTTHVSNNFLWSQRCSFEPLKFDCICYYILGRDQFRDYSFAYVPPYLFIAVHFPRQSHNAWRNTNKTLIICILSFDPKHQTCIDTRKLFLVNVNNDRKKARRNRETYVTGEKMEITLFPDRGSNPVRWTQSPTLYHVAIKAALYRKAVQMYHIPIPGDT